MNLGWERKKITICKSNVTLKRRILKTHLLCNHWNRRKFIKTNLFKFITTIINVNKYIHDLYKLTYTNIIKVSKSLQTTQISFKTIICKINEVVSSTTNSQEDDPFETKTTRYVQWPCKTFHMTTWPLGLELKPKLTTLPKDVEFSSFFSTFGQIRISLHLSNNLSMYTLVLLNPISIHLVSFFIDSRLKALVEL